jgi:broad specificity phosphatase PhoE
MRLVLVRHGESVGNFENRLQGQEDYDLTDKGRLEAASTAERLAAMRTHAVYSSPLLRARHTAVTIAERLGVALTLLPEVSEYDFGRMSGSTYAEVRQHFAGRSSSPPGPQERIYPGEEGRENFANRVTAALWRVIDAHPRQIVAVVSHGGPIALFCQSVLSLPYQRPMPFSIGNCSLTVIDVEEQHAAPRDGRKAVLSSLNDVCHLRARVDAGGL